jgi:CheY-like chemotaxis protein
MPIVDGLTSTKMIRSFEKSHPGSHLSIRASGNGRVPIFAVSASLVERERLTYINAGFDGWILKPIDFKRLNILLLGIVKDESRSSCLYKPGEWEKGGWFYRRQPSVLEASTSPSDKSPVQKPPQKDIVQPDLDSVHSSESGSITPKMEPSRKPLIHDERLDAPKEGERDTFFPSVKDHPLEDATNLNGA